MRILLMRNTNNGEKANFKFMRTIIGNKNTIAIELQESFIYADSIFPIRWFNMCLWLGQKSIGDFNNVESLSPLFQTFQWVVKNKKMLWLPELENLECWEIFFKVNPTINDPDSFFDLSEIEQDKQCIYDRFIFNFGDSFSDWAYTIVCKENQCKFLWAYNPNRIENDFYTKDIIECYDVNMSEIEEIYLQLKEFFPNLSDT